MKIVWASALPTLRKAALPLLFTVAAVLYLWLPGAGSDTHSKLQDSVLTLRTQAGELERQAAEVERLAALPPAAMSTDTLLIQVRAAATRASIAESLLRTEAGGPDQVAVSASALDFRTLLLWLEELQALNIRVDGARITAGGQPGLVSITATLLRPTAP